MHDGAGSRYTKDQLTSAVAQATMADVLRALGVAPRCGNYETAWDRMRRWGIDGAHLKGATQREGWSVPDDELRGAVAANLLPRLSGSLVDNPAVPAIDTFELGSPTFELTHPTCWERAGGSAAKSLLFLPDQSRSTS